jgi:hypothetical protein
VDGLTCADLIGEDECGTLNAEVIDRIVMQCTFDEAEGCSNNGLQCPIPVIGE